MYVAGALQVETAAQLELANRFPILFFDQATPVWVILLFAVVAAVHLVIAFRPSGPPGRLVLCAVAGGTWLLTVYLPIPFAILGAILGTIAIFEPRRAPRAADGSPLAVAQEP